VPVPRRRLPAGTRADRRRPLPHPRVHRRRRSDGRLPAPRRGRARLPRRGPASARLASRRAGTRSRVPRRHHRCRHVGHPGRAPPAAGGRAVHDPRQERRRRWHLARERLPRVSGRQPEPQLQLLVRAAARLAVPLLAAGRARAVLPRLRRHVRDPSARPVRVHGAAQRVGRAREDVDRALRGGWRRAHHHRSCGDQRGRSAQPAAVAHDRRHRRLRGPVLPLGRMAARPRPHRQEGRRHRHRRERTAVHPRGREGGRPRHRLPAHAALDRADTRLPRRDRTRPQVAVRPRPHVQRAQPVRDLLADGRRGDRRCAGRPELAGRRFVGERDQRVRQADAARVLPRAVRRSSRPARGGHPALPGRRQARRARQRHLGHHAQAAERRAAHRCDRARRRHRCGDGRRLARRRRRDHLRHRIPGVEVPHADAR
jgi:hypothetical protein